MRERVGLEMSRHATERRRQRERDDSQKAKKKKKNVKKKALWPLVLVFSLSRPSPLVQSKRGRIE
jgi:hypothetical protein